VCRLIAIQKSIGVSGIPKKLAVGQFDWLQAEIMALPTKASANRLRDDTKAIGEFIGSDLYSRAGAQKCDIVFHSVSSLFNPFARYEEDSSRCEHR
jgi:hypothetical protein